MSTVITTLFLISVLAFLVWNVVLKIKEKELFPIKPLLGFILGISLVGVMFQWLSVVSFVLAIILFFTRIYKNGWGFFIGFLLVNWPILFAVSFLISYFLSHRGGDVQFQFIGMDEPFFMTAFVLSIVLALVRIFVKRKNKLT